MLAGPRGRGRGDLPSSHAAEHPPAPLAGSLGRAGTEGAQQDSQRGSRSPPATAPIGRAAGEGEGLIRLIKCVGRGNGLRFPTHKAQRGHLGGLEGGAQPLPWAEPW